MMSNFVLEFFIFLFVIGGLYSIPAGLFYFFYHSKVDVDSSKIQPTKPSRKDVRREIFLSLGTVFIFAIGSTLIFQLIKQGYSQFYYNWSDYFIGYQVISFFLCLLVHDTYFYWAHRLMHWKPLFKYFHIGHHRSLVPTPWASLAFQPLESIVQFGTFVVVIFVVPVHPIVFGLYVLYDTIVNTLGHNGFEVAPKWSIGHPIFKFTNTVTHHEIHHQDFNANYGAFLNVWDRIMGTFSDEMKTK